MASTEHRAVAAWSRRAGSAGSGTRPSEGDAGSAAGSGSPVGVDPARWGEPGQAVDDGDGPVRRGGSLGGGVGTGGRGCRGWWRRRGPQNRMWWAWQRRGGRSQPGNAQPPSRMLRARRMASVTVRCNRPTSRGSDFEPSTTGTTSASQAHRRTVAGSTGAPVSRAPWPVASWSHRRSIVIVTSARPGRCVRPADGPRRLGAARLRDQRVLVAGTRSRGGAVAASAVGVGVVGAGRRRGGWCRR